MSANNLESGPHITISALTWDRFVDKPDRVERSVPAEKADFRRELASLDHWRYTACSLMLIDTTVRCRVTVFKIENRWWPCKQHGDRLEIFGLKDTIQPDSKRFEFYEPIWGTFAFLPWAHYLSGEDAAAATFKVLMQAPVPSTTITQTLDFLPVADRQRYFKDPIDRSDFDIAARKFIAQEGDYSS